VDEDGRGIVACAPCRPIRSTPSPKAAGRPNRPFVVAAVARRRRQQYSRP